MKDVVTKLEALEQRYRRFSSRMLKAYVVLAVTNVVALAIGGVLIDRNATTRNAVCTLRANLEQRVAGSEAFVKDHPEGFAGISAAQIERDIAQQRQTIKALDAVSCGGP